MSSLISLHSTDVQPAEKVSEDAGKGGAAEARIGDHFEANQLLVKGLLGGWPLFGSPYTTIVIVYCSQFATLSSPPFSRWSERLLLTGGLYADAAGQMVTLWVWYHCWAAVARSFATYVPAGD